MLFKNITFYIGIKRRSTINRSVRSAINKEKAPKMCNISVRLVDIAKTYEKRETMEKKDCLNINCEQKNAFLTDTKYNDKIVVSNVSNMNNVTDIKIYNTYNFP